MKISGLLVIAVLAVSLAFIIPNTRILGQDAKCSEPLSTSFATQNQSSSQLDETSVVFQNFIVPFVSNKSGVYAPVLLMQPGSEATICMIYTYPTDFNYTGTSFSTSYAIVYGWVTTTNQNTLDSGTTETSTIGQLIPTSSVTIGSNPRNFSISAGHPENESVGLTLTASKNATGYYGLLFADECVPIPLAIGYKSTQLNLSDFQGYLAQRFCPYAQIGSVYIVGLSSMGIGYVKE